MHFPHCDMNDDEWFRGPRPLVSVSAGSYLPAPQRERKMGLAGRLALRLRRKQGYDVQAAGLFAVVTATHETKGTIN